MHDAAQLAPREAEHKGPKRQHSDTQNQRQELQSKARAQRQDAQQGPQNSIAKETAQTETVGRRPDRPRRQRRGIESHHSQPDRRKDKPPHGALFAPMERKPRAPDARHKGKPPRTPADDHEERRGYRRSDPPHPVPCRFIGGRHPAWVVRAVGDHHRRRHSGQHDERQSQQFLAALLDRCGHSAVEQRVTSTCLICHLFLVLPHP